jgi:uncharacterized protein CbrC (UPF0167 family)
VKVTANGSALQSDIVCEMCGVRQPYAHEDWQHHSNEVEEVEVSWANGDQGVLRRFRTRRSFDLCPTCAVP